MASPNGAIGIIGGSGLYDIDGLEDEQWLAIETPVGRTRRTKILFGTHRRRESAIPAAAWPRAPGFSPTELNSAAPISMRLKRAGCTDHSRDFGGGIAP